MASPDTDPNFATQLRDLCGWASTLAQADIPEAVMRQAAFVLADDMAALISARDDPVLKDITAQFLRTSGQPVATLFDGSGRRADRYTAAAINGAAAPWNELDEGSRRVPCHAGIYILPALLAEAEAENLSLGEVLRCLVIAYEVTTRMALVFAQPSLKLHPHASLCAIGAAAGVAVARRYDKEQFHNAITIAATLISPGPFQHAVRGSFARNMWVSSGAWSGMRAADWVLCGVTGLPESPQEVFQGIFATDFRPEHLLRHLGQDWLILHNFQKIFPCCQYAHSMIEAILALQETLPKGKHLGDCSGVVIEIHEKGLHLHERVPQTILAARFSVPHIAAVAIACGGVDVETLSPASLGNPEIAALRDRIEMRLFEPEMPPPNDRPARVTVRFTDGPTLSSECLNARGSPGAAFTAAEILEKIGTICNRPYPNLPGIMKKTVNLDATTLALPWADLVANMREAKTLE